MRLVYAFLALAFFVGGIRTAGAQVTDEQMSVAGTARTYHVFAPPGVAAHAPLVIALHGGGGSGAGFVRLSGLNATAAKHGFVVVYPDAIARQWNDGRTDTPRPWPAGSVDDVAFLDALIARLAADRGVDTDRVFVAGLSNGGFMAQYFACRDAAKIAAIASVSASLAPSVRDICRPAKPVPILYVLGTNDPIVPYGGGNVHILSGSRGAVLSGAASAAWWRSFNRCTASTSTTIADTAGDGTSITEERWQCAGAPVQVDVVHGGGHGWPGGRPYLPARLVGTTSRNLDTNETMWEFFLRAVRKSPG